MIYMLICGWWVLGSASLILVVFDDRPTIGDALFCILFGFAGPFIWIAALVATACQARFWEKPLFQR